MKTKIGYAVAALLALTAGFAQGQEKGIESITRECSTCHDTGAVSASSAIPLLAAQQAPYLVAQLKAFRDRSRPDPHAQTPMWSIAARLTDDVIAKIAAYYASQQPRQGTPTDPGETSVGKKIYEEGVEAQHVIACQLCHGPKAAGKGPFPRLAGQQRGYLERQLAAFAANLRAHAIMHENAKNLTTLQISQVAAFLSAAQ